MTRSRCRGIAVIALLLAGASSGWCQQFLYSPTAVNSGQQAEKKDGVLVQEVQVQKGDTLYDISKKFSGHGTYYPQILLFNELKNPNLIYPGNVLRIPVTRKPHEEAAAPVRKEKRSAASPRIDAPLPTTRKEASAKPASSVPAAIELSTSELKKSETIREKKRVTKNKPEERAIKADSVEKRSAAPATGRYTAKAVKVQSRPTQGDSAASQKLFEQAVKAYRQEDYRSALDLFDRFLNDNPSSSLAPDASLYKAECYLKQANQ
jgi:LysM repeat protein